MPWQRKQIIIRCQDGRIRMGRRERRSEAGWEQADAARKEAEARAMRHSGDYRVKHVKSATTPAKTGVKTLVQNKEISPFHSLMENLRKGFAGQP